MAETIEAAQPRAHSGPESPAVSICIPTFNGALWVCEAIESALAQSWADLEVVVCDDASSDDTVRLAAEFTDPRVSVIAHRERVGMARNWNRCVQRSRGAYVKFLMQDDRLAPDCLDRMLGVFAERPGIGLVFSARELAFEDPDDPAAEVFRRRFGALQTRLGSLARVNGGRMLLTAMRRDRFRLNMIGEPTAVMVSREALSQLGLFNVRIRQLTDLEMWLRVAARFDVGFVPEPVAAFRVHRRSASAANERTGSDWLDRVWLLEGLWADGSVRREISKPAWLRLWLLTYANAGKRLVTDGLAPARPHLRELGRYLRYRFARHPADAVHESLVEPERRPTFSVVTPAYNGKAKLEATLRSVLSQAVDDLEYLVVDGASSDGTGEWLAGLDDPRIRFWSEPDAGIYDAMNKGIGHARGRYLLFLGAGDTLLPGALRQVGERLPARDSSLVYGDVLREGRRYGGRFSRRKICDRNICHQAIFYGRDLFRMLGGYDLTYPLLADWAFNIRAFGDHRIGKRYVPVTVAVYQGGGASMGRDEAFNADRARLLRTSLGTPAYAVFKATLPAARAYRSLKATLRPRAGAPRI